MNFRQSRRGEQKNERMNRSNQTNQMKQTTWPALLEDPEFSIRPQLCRDERGPAKEPYLLGRDGKKSVKLTVDRVYVRPESLAQNVEIVFTHNNSSSLRISLHPADAKAIAWNIGVAADFVDSFTEEGYWGRAHSTWTLEDWETWKAAGCPDV